MCEVEVVHFQLVVIMWSLLKSYIWNFFMCLRIVWDVSFLWFLKLCFVRVISFARLDGCYLLVMFTFSLQLIMFQNGWKPSPLELMMLRLLYILSDLICFAGLDLVEPILLQPLYLFYLFNFSFSLYCLPIFLIILLSCFCLLYQRLDLNIESNFSWIYFFY